jgi:membrane-bound lytic murein transglycosylase B
LKGIGRRVLGGMVLGVALQWAAALVGVAAAPEEPQQGFPARALEDFAQRVAQKHGIDRGEVFRVLGQAKFQPRVIELITRPAESRPWVEYRELFITPKRIVGGVEFWNDHAESLARARARYGVSEEIIVAIIGVETLYGERTGSYRVLDALATLAFGFPRRSAYFTGELENFILLARANGLDPSSLLGSYAGAIGIPQFMPGSYLAYAVDFDGDGKADLSSSPVDAIGSVAHYLNRHGWAQGEPAAVPASLARPGAAQADAKPRRTVAELQAAGVQPLGTVAPEVKAALLEFDERDGKQYWLGLPNFFVIKRYNNSDFYAMVVSQLAEEVKALREAMRRPRPMDALGAASKRAQ